MLLVGENQAIVRYNFRLRPSKSAEARLIEEWNCCRWVWNQCVETGNSAYEAFKSGIPSPPKTPKEMGKNLTDWRNKLDWLRVGSYCAQQETARKWIASYKRAMRRGFGFPDFKSCKVSKPSMGYTTNSFKIEGKNLVLVKGIVIPIVWSRALPSKPSSCVVFRDSEGHWNVSFVVRREKVAMPKADAAIGIDWGVKCIATTTNADFDLAATNQFRANETALRKAQRKSSRAKKGSKGWHQAKHSMAKICASAMRQRRDVAFKWARRVVTNFGRIAVEDFKPSFLAKTKMAKKATDGAVGMTKRILVNMAESAGRTVVLVPPAHTTQTCSKCGSRNKTRLTLNNRTFVCESCGHTADRDRNAAWTILARAGFNPTNADDVRPLHDFGCAAAV